jgi:putative PIN family toxin of toxin-antitoxin system
VSKAVRVILDTGTLVSAALRVGSTPHKALARALQIGEVCMCGVTFTELEEVLMRRKFDLYQPVATRQAFIQFMRSQTAWFDVQASHIAGINPPCRDSKDHPFLALALQSQATVVVLSDADLLVLNPWQGIPIVNPAAFLMTV